MCFTLSACSQLYHYIFLPPYPYEQLHKKDKAAVLRLVVLEFGIYWNVGSIAYADMPKVIAPLASCRQVFTCSDDPVKIEFMRQAMPNIDIRPIYVSGLCATSKQFVCDHHTHNTRICAVAPVQHCILRHAKGKKDPGAVTAATSGSFF